MLAAATGSPAIGAPGAGAAVSLTVGGLTLAVRANDARLRFAPGPGSDAFYADGAVPDVLLHARLEDLDRWTPGETVFDTHGSWKLTRENDVLSFACLAAKRGAAPYKVARIRPGATEGELLLHRGANDAETAIEPLQFPLAELLYIDLLARRGGVLMHACGVVSNGRGVLFSGHSQDGKTTTARLWHGRRGATVISDDRIVVRPDGAGLRIHGTPWHGDGQFAEALSAPLEAVFLLEKAPKDEIREVPRAEAATKLLARSFPAFYSAESMERTLGFIEGLVSKVPCMALRFRPKASAVELVSRWLEKRP